jgi:hypothetical protein
VDKAKSYVSVSRTHGRRLLVDSRYVTIITLLLKNRISFFSATAVDVERVFSKGRLLLSHVRNRLSVESTRALMCLGEWSLLGSVKDCDIKAVTILPELDNDEDDVLAPNWDMIK